MTQKSVVFFTNVPFNLRDYDRYGIEWWLDAGFAVTVLDVGYFALPSRAPEWDNQIYRNDRFDLVVLHRRSELKQYRILLSGASLIVDLTTAHGHSRWNLPILRAISRSKTPYIVLSVNAYPGYDLPLDQSRDLAGKIGVFLARLKAADPVNAFIARLPCNWLGIRPATAVVYGGRRSRRRITTVAANTLEIFGHHMDYDLFLDQDSEISSDNTAVFIDQDLGGHREFVSNKAFRPMDTERYYQLLRTSLERVEKITGLEIVIAKHPHALSADPERFLPNWRIVQGQTLDLIRKSKLVIAHNSAAITSVVLNRKPLLLIFSKDYIDSSHWNPVSHYPLAEALERNCLYLEDIAEADDEEFMADLTAGFDTYIEDYISVGPLHREKLWPTIGRALSDHEVISGIPLPANQSMAKRQPVGETQCRLGTESSGDLR
jgi:hypothetical protein